MYSKSILPNGIRVVSESIPYVKSVTLGVWVGTGARSEQDYNHGISHFIEHLMFKGTATRTAREIAEEVDAVGGQLNAFTAKEHTCYYVKVLDSHVDLAIDMLSDMLLRSKFDPEDINREREVVLEEVHMYDDTPDELIHDIHLGKIWPGHRLGSNILGTKESIEKFDRTLVQEYYAKYYTPDNLVIAAAGNFVHEDLMKLVEKYFGKLTGSKAKLQTVPPILQPVRTVYNKDTEQVHLCLGMPGVPQKHPDIYGIHLLSNMLGGGISSRLFQSIREERGLAYSVYSYQTNYSDAGLLTIYAGTRPANVKQVMELILENIADLRKCKITEQELTKNKEQLKGSLMLGMESSSSHMSRIGKMEISLGRYVSLDEVIEKIERVTLADLQQIAAKIFDPRQMAFTALGPVDESIWL